MQFLEGLKTKQSRFVFAAYRAVHWHRHRDCWTDRETDKHKWTKRQAEPERNYTIQYNVLLLQSQRVRCEGDIRLQVGPTIVRITDICHAGQYRGTVLQLLTTGSILGMENTVYKFVPVVILSIGSQRIWRRFARERWPCGWTGSSCVSEWCDYIVTSHHNDIVPHSAVRA